MDKQAVISFFDRCASWWDEDMIRREPVITAILDNAGVTSGKRVLDVACGTGVLIPDYLARGATVTAIDISPEMIRRARGKFPLADIRCGDVEEASFEEPFDVVMVYNAMPHFPNPERLIHRLASLLAPGGMLSVAHGMSREALLAHHNGRSAEVSIPLLEAEELARLFACHLRVTQVISNEEMYQVVGIKE